MIPEVPSDLLGRETGEAAKPGEEKVVAKTVATMTSRSPRREFIWRAVSAAHFLAPEEREAIRAGLISQDPAAIHALKDAMRVDQVVAMTMPGPSSEMLDKLSEEAKNHFTGGLHNGHFSSRRINPIIPIFGLSAPSLTKIMDRMVEHDAAARTRRREARIRAQAARIDCTGANI